MNVLENKDGGQRGLRRDHQVVARWSQIGNLLHSPLQCWYLAHSIAILGNNSAVERLYRPVVGHERELHHLFRTPSCSDHQAQSRRGTQPWGFVAVSVGASELLQQNKRRRCDRSLSGMACRLHTCESEMCGWERITSTSVSSVHGGVDSEPR